MRWLSLWLLLVFHFNVKVIQLSINIYATRKTNFSRTLGRFLSKHVLLIDYNNLEYAAGKALSKEDLPFCPRTPGRWSPRKCTWRQFTSPALFGPDYFGACVQLWTSISMSTWEFRHNVYSYIRRMAKFQEIHFRVAATAFVHQALRVLSSSVKFAPFRFDSVPYSFLLNKLETIACLVSPTTWLSNHFVTTVHGACLDWKNHNRRLPI